MVTSKKNGSLTKKICDNRNALQLERFRDPFKDPEIMQALKYIS